MDEDMDYSNDDTSHCSESEGEDLEWDDTLDVEADKDPVDSKIRRIGKYQSLRYMFSLIFGQEVDVVDGVLTFSSAGENSNLWSGFDSYDKDLISGVSLFSMYSLFFKDDVLSTLLMYADSEVREKITIQFIQIIQEVLHCNLMGFKPVSDLKVINHIMSHKTKVIQAHKKRIRKNAKSSVKEDLISADIDAMYKLKQFGLQDIVIAVYQVQTCPDKQLHMIKTIRTSMHLVYSRWLMKYYNFYRSEGRSGLDVLGMRVRGHTEFKMTGAESVMADICTELGISWRPMLEDQDEPIFLVEKIDSGCKALLSKVGSGGIISKKDLEESKLYETLKFRYGKSKLFTESGGLVSANYTTELMKLLTEIQESYSGCWKYLPILCQMLTNNSDVQLDMTFMHLISKMHQTPAFKVLPMNWQKDFLCVSNVLMHQLYSGQSSWHMWLRLKGLVGELDRCLAHNLEYVSEEQKLTLEQILNSLGYEDQTSSSTSLLLNRTPDAWHFDESELSLTIYEFAWCFDVDWKTSKEKSKWQGLESLLSSMGLTGGLVIDVLKTSELDRMCVNTRVVADDLISVKRVLARAYKQDFKQITMLECTIGGYRDLIYHEDHKIRMKQSTCDRMWDYYAEALPKRADLLKTVKDKKRIASEQDIERLYEQCVPKTESFMGFNLVKFNESMDSMRKSGKVHVPRYDVLIKCPVPDLRNEFSVSDEIHKYAKLNPFYQMFVDPELKLINSGSGLKVQCMIRRLELCYCVIIGLESFFDWNSCLFCIDQKLKQTISIRDYEEAKKKLIEQCKKRKKDPNQSEEETLNDRVCEQILECFSDLEPYPLSPEVKYWGKSMHSTLMRARSYITYHPEKDQVSFIQNPDWQEKTEKGWCVELKDRNHTRLSLLRQQLCSETVGGPRSTLKDLSYEGIIQAWENEDLQDCQKITVEFLKSLMQEISAVNAWTISCFYHNLAEAIDSSLCRSVDKSASQIGMAKVPDFNCWVMVKKHRSTNQNYKCVLIGESSRFETTVHGSDWYEGVSRPFIVDTRALTSMLSYPGKMMMASLRLLAHSGSSVLTANILKGVCDIMLLAFKDSLKVDNNDSVRRYTQHAVLMDLSDPKIYAKMDGPFRSTIEVWMIERHKKHINELYRYRSMIMQYKKDHDFDSIRKLDLPSFLYKGTCKIASLIESNYLYHFLNKQQGSSVMQHLIKSVNKSVSGDVANKKTSEFHEENLPQGFCDGEPMNANLPINKQRLPFDYGFVYSAAMEGAKSCSDTIKLTIQDARKELNMTLPEIKNSSLTVSAFSTEIETEKRKKDLESNKVKKQAFLSKRMIDTDFIDESGHRQLTRQPPKNKTAKYLEGPQVEESRMKVNMCSQSLSVSSWTFDDVFNTNLCTLFSSRKVPESVLFRDLASRLVEDLIDTLHDLAIAGATKVLVHESESSPVMMFQMEDELWKQYAEEKLRLSHEQIEEMGHEFWLGISSSSSMKVAFWLETSYSCSRDITSFDSLLTLSKSVAGIPVSDSSMAFISKALKEADYVSWGSEWPKTVQRHRQFCKPQRKEEFSLPLHKLSPYSVELSKLSETLSVNESHSVAGVASKMLTKFTDEDVKTVFPFMVMSKVQHAGDRAIFTTTACGKILLRVVETLCGGVGKGIRGSITDVLLQNDSEKRFSEDVKSMYSSMNSDLDLGIHQSQYFLMGSEDCAGWGDLHDPIAFLVSIWALQDATSIFTQDEMRYFEVFFLSYMTKRKVLIPESIINRLLTIEPEELPEEGKFLLDRLYEGKPYWEKRINDMHQGILHATSSMYAALTKHQTNRLTARYVDELSRGRVVLTFHDAQSSDDSGVVMKFISSELTQAQMNSFMEVNVSKILEFRKNHKRAMNMETSPKSSYDRFICEFKSKWILGPDEGGTDMAPTIKFTTASTNINKFLSLEEYYIGGCTEASEVFCEGGTYSEAIMSLLERCSQGDIIASDREYRYDNQVPIFCGAMPLPGPTELMLGSVQDIQARSCKKGPTISCQIGIEGSIIPASFVVPMSKSESMKKKKIQKLMGRQAHSSADFDSCYNSFKSRYFPVKTTDSIRLRYEQGLSQKMFLSLTLPKDPIQYRRKSRAVCKSRLWMWDRAEKTRYSYKEIVAKVMEMSRTELNLTDNQQWMLQMDGVKLTRTRILNVTHLESVSGKMKNTVNSLVNPAPFVCAVFSKTLRRVFEGEGPWTYSEDVRDELRRLLMVAEITDDELWQHYGHDSLHQAFLSSDLRSLELDFYMMSSSIKDLTWEKVFQILSINVNREIKSANRSLFFLIKRTERLSPLVHFESTLNQMILPSTMILRQDPNIASFTKDQTDYTDDVLSGIDMFLATDDQPNSDRTRKIVSQFMTKPDESNRSPMVKCMMSAPLDKFSNKSRKMNALSSYIGVNSLNSKSALKNAGYRRELVGFTAIYEINACGHSIALARDRRSKTTTINTSTSDLELFLTLLNKILCMLYDDESKLGSELFETCNSGVITFSFKDNMAVEGFEYRATLNQNLIVKAVSPMDQTGQTCIYSDGFIVMTVSGNIQRFDQGSVQNLVHRLTEAKLNSEADMVSSLSLEAEKRASIPLFSRRIKLANLYNRQSCNVYLELCREAGRNPIPKEKNLPVDLEVLDTPINKIFQAIVKADLVESSAVLFREFEVFPRESNRLMLSMLMERLNRSKRGIKRKIIPPTEIRSLNSLIEQFVLWEAGYQTASMMKTFLMMIAQKTTVERLLAQRFSDKPDKDVGLMLDMIEKDTIVLANVSGSRIFLDRVDGRMYLSCSGEKTTNLLEEGWDPWTSVCLLSGMPAPHGILDDKGLINFGPVTEDILLPLMGKGFIGYPLLNSQDDTMIMSLRQNASRIDTEVENMRLINSKLPNRFLRQTANLLHKIHMAGSDLMSWDNDPG